MAKKKEDVPVSRKRGVEVMRHQVDGSREIATILMSLGVASSEFQSGRVLLQQQLRWCSCRHGIEHRLVVDYATGWDMEDEEQMKEVERRIIGEKNLYC